MISIFRIKNSKIKSFRPKNILKNTGSLISHFFEENKNHDFSNQEENCK